LLGKGDVLLLPHIALGAALPVIVGSPRRWGILRRIDWQTLIFFAAMFVVMESVWRTGFFQWALAEMQVDVLSTGVILGVSVLLSQLISNVPLVALYQPLMLHAGAGAPELMALAAGSTIAGNLFILGAASNVIIIQNAEKRTGDTLTFFEFARAGVPLTILNVLVYWIFLRFL
jgi:Na+/H+ antiporter NhaD/arsenite permease-like protein